MINVLHIMAGADAGGISSVVLNYYSHIDRKKIHFDVAMTVNVIGVNGMRLQELGVKFYNLPMKSQDMYGFKNGISRLIREHHYDAIHVHENETSYIALQVAKKEGVKCRIAHGHTARPVKDLKGYIKLLASRILNPLYATKTIGCGILAGDKIFGRWCMKSNKGLLLPNAIDTTHFQFNEVIRDEVRKELGIKNEFVVGMVGRISPEKNNVYGVELFETIKKTLPNAILIIVGNGPYENIMLDKVKELNLTKSVKYLGRRSDVYRLFQAFDIYILPSLYEGFPVAATEAMASGLPVLMSDKITKELSFGKNVRYISLEDKQAWAMAAMEYVSGVNRAVLSKEIKKNGFDINDTVKKLEQLYFEQCLQK